MGLFLRSAALVAIFLLGSATVVDGATTRSALLFNRLWERKSAYGAVTARLTGVAARR